MRRRSRAARDLALAPLSYCPSCGRETKTVGNGACAECWQAKDIGGSPGIPVVRGRTEPLLDVDWEVVLWVLVVVAALGLAAALRLVL